MKNIDKHKVQVIENLLNYNKKIISFFQTDLTKYKILLMTMKSYYQNDNQEIFLFLMIVSNH